MTEATLILRSLLLLALTLVALEPGVAAAQPAIDSHVAAAKAAARGVEMYIASAERFGSLAAQSGADVILSNHTAFDGSMTKLPALASRRPGAPHPYVVGTEHVTRYLRVASECAKAGLARLQAP